MVGNNADDCAPTAELFGCGANLADYSVQPLKHREGRSAVRAALMLFFIEAPEIRKVKARPLLFENIDVEDSASLVALDRIIVAISVGTKRVFGFRKESRRRQRANELAILIVLGAPILRDIESNVRSNGRGPIDARRGEPGFCCSVPERRHFDVFGIPIT